MKKFFNEFREFAMRGNVLDMAIGVVLGSAFGKITTSLVNDVFMPLIGLVIGGIDLGKLDIILKPAVMNGDKEVTAAVTLGLGTFLTTIIDFILVAFVIFLMVKAINAFHKKKDEARRSHHGGTADGDPGPAEGAEIKWNASCSRASRPGAFPPTPSPGCRNFPGSCWRKTGS